MTKDNSISKVTRSIYPNQFVNDFLDKLVARIPSGFHSPDFYINGCKIAPQIFTGFQDSEGVDHVNRITSLPRRYFELLPNEADLFEVIGNWYATSSRHGCYAFGYSELVEGNTLLVRVSFFDQRTAQAKLKLQGGNVGSLYVAEREIEYCDGSKHPVSENSLMNFFYGVTKGLNELQHNGENNEI